jgi:small conductance mechanosensitive channel
MFYYLGTGDASQVLPGVDLVKEKLIEEKNTITHLIDSLLQSLKDFTPKLISAIIALIIGLWLIKRIAKVAEKAMVRRELEISLRTFIKSLVSIGLKIVLIVIVVGMLGIGTTSFVTILGAAGLAVGLALQGSLSNFAGGVLILIFKPFKVGDIIEAGGQIGEVREIQIFNTILLTGDHKTVILPNGPLSNGTIVNNTRHGSLRADLMLMISPENDLDLVKRVIREVLQSNEKIIKEIEPGIVFGRVADGVININVRPYTIPKNMGSMTSELYYQIHKAFESNNIKIPQPVRFINNAK